MTPEQLAKAGTEHAHQVALFAWCALNTSEYPELAWFHSVPNGGSRGEDDKSRMIAGGKMKAEGLKRGVADTFLPVARGVWHGLYIELKKPSVKAGKDAGLSLEQKQFRDFVMSQGYGWIVCYSWEDARDVLISYLKYPKYGELK